jgi:hypothetical protein
MRDAKKDLDAAKLALRNHAITIRKKMKKEQTTTGAGAIVNPYKMPVRRRSQAEEQQDDCSIPEFSKFSDKHRYNGRVLSKYAVDSVVTSIFNH